MGNVALVAILGTSILLRFYRISENLVFHGELGANYLAIKNFILSGQIPLLGPPTSHPWLSFGPLYYWIFGPILAFFRYNPIAGAYFFALIGVLVVYANFFVVLRLFNEKTALISSFLLSISPAWIYLVREARFFSLAILFFYPFLLYFVKALEGNISFLWAGFFLGIMFNFHLSPIILLLPVFILIYSQRKKYTNRSLFKGFVGFAIPNIPFLLADSLTGFVMFRNLFLWIPYRIAGFMGLYPKNTMSTQVLIGNIESAYEYLTKTFMPESNIFILAIVLTMIASVALIKKKNLMLKSLLLILLLGYLGIFIHGDPPYHYYLPLYPILPILISVFLVRLNKRFILLAVLFLLTFINLKYYFSDKWFYLHQDKINEGRPVPYPLQLKAVEYIIRDTSGEPFNLKRVGEYDSFEGNYSQNYKYLLWLKGNEPVKEASLEYSIIEKVGSEPEVSRQENK